MSEAVKVAVVGGGAMGTIFAAGLVSAGVDTTVIEVSTSLVALLREKGVVIVDADGRRTVRLPVTSDPAEAGHADLVFFFVKCYQTESAAGLASPLIGESTTVVSLQNGWGNGDVLTRQFPANPLVVGVTYSSGSVREPGVIAHTNAGATFLGPYEEAYLPAAQRVATLLGESGFETTLVESIRTEIWKKLVLNSATLATSALTRSTASELDASDEMTDLIDAIARETTAVGRAAGYEVDEAERIRSIHEVLRDAGSGKASMLQDIEAGRRTEIDVISGAVMRVAASVDVPAPLNSALFALVKKYEQATGTA